MAIISLLNDGETWTDANNCGIISVEEDTTEDIEQALRDDDYSHAVTIEVNNGVLIVHINDSSGIPIVINDERVDPDADEPLATGTYWERVTLQWPATLNTEGHVVKVGEPEIVYMFPSDGWNGTENLDGRNEFWEVMN